MKLQCLECEQEFVSSSVTPECPNCGGSDIDLAWE